MEVLDIRKNGTMLVLVHMSKGDEVGIFLMTLASCLYHAMVYETKHKYVFRILDHIFIYVAIAGSYTPIALYVIGGWQGWLILVIQWAMVLFGVLYKSIAQKSVPKLSVLIYLCM